MIRKNIISSMVCVLSVANCSLYGMGTDNSWLPCNRTAVASELPASPSQHPVITPELTPEARAQKKLHDLEQTVQDQHKEFADFSAQSQYLLSRLIALESVCETQKRTLEELQYERINDKNELAETLRLEAASRTALHDNIHTALENNRCAIDQQNTELRQQTEARLAIIENQIIVNNAAFTEHAAKQQGHDQQMDHSNVRLDHRLSAVINHCSALHQSLDATRNLLDARIDQLHLKTTNLLHLIFRHSSNCFETYNAVLGSSCFDHTLKNDRLVMRKGK